MTSKVYVFGSDRVEAEISSEENGWARLTVNGDMSEKYTYYRGILSHMGYCLASEYWSGALPVNIPFKITMFDTIEGGALK